MSDSRLRGNRPRRSGPYPLGQIPDEVLIEISKQVVHRLAIGMSDITGDDFGTIFANGVQGEHRSSPIGIADVAWNGCGWSVKTVKSSKPFETKRVRLISGRNSPDYSHGIADPHADIQATGRAVLSIWNARVNEALDEFDELRIVTFIRNIDTREFVIFEEEAQRFIPNDYGWGHTQQGNLRGVEKLTGVHRFTWQFHGSQFTVHREVPVSSRRFAITPHVPIVALSDVLHAVRFREDWVDILR